MKDTLSHKDFIGSVQFSASDETFHGKIEGINDLVTFEGSTVTDLKTAFVAAVEDYIALCEAVGKDPLKSFKGSFNVRISPHLHARAFKAARLRNLSLNQLVQQALEQTLDTTP